MFFSLSGPVFCYILFVKTHNRLWNKCENVDKLIVENIHLLKMNLDIPEEDNIVLMKPSLKCSAGCSRPGLADL